MFEVKLPRTITNLSLVGSIVLLSACAVEAPESEEIITVEQAYSRHGKSAKVATHGKKKHHGFARGKARKGKRVYGKSPQGMGPKPQLTVLDSSYSGVDIGDGGAEIVAHDPASQRLFVSNADAKTVDVIDVSDPTNLVRLEDLNIDITPYGAQVNSVAVSGGIVAAAIEASPKQDPGVIAFFDTDGAFLSQVTVGALPDMVIFTPNGQSVLVANEGEPNEFYGDLSSPDRRDPEGSISVIDIRGGVAHLTQADVRTADFTAFNDNINAGVRITGPGATVAQDLEPEYITVSENSRTAWVTLQENNAIAIVDIKHATVTDVVPLGFKDHSLPGNGFDPSDKDDEINIANYPIKGLYMPDAIDNFRVHGDTFTIMGNEGDAREYGDEDEDFFYIDEAKCADLDLDPEAFPDAKELQGKKQLGRLRCVTTEGDTDGDGDYDELYSFGARSFSIRDASGQLVFDSGDQIEQTIAILYPENFNANDDDPEAKKRSDNKGPEPEGVVVGKVRGRTYAFIGLERMSGIMVYDVSNPYAPTFEQYLNTRDFTASDPYLMGDLAPEGMIFVSPGDSPTGKALLVVAFEVSATTTVFEFD